MPLNKSFIAELQYESSLTRKALQRILADKLSWKPHETSVSLSRLATHIADIHQWPVLMIGADELDMSKKSLAPVAQDNLDTILQNFESYLKDTLTVLETADDEKLDQLWTLRAGDHTIFTMPRKQVLRGMVISHIIHHRGQLTVYLRMLGVPVPAIYGPSADERPF